MHCKNETGLQFIHGILWWLIVPVCFMTFSIWLKIVTVSQTAFTVSWWTKWGRSCDSGSKRYPPRRLICYTAGWRPWQVSNEFFLLLMMEDPLTEQSIRMHYSLSYHNHSECKYHAERKCIPLKWRRNPSPIHLLVMFLSFATEQPASRYETFCNSIITQRASILSGVGLAIIFKWFTLRHESESPVKSMEWWPFHCFILVTKGRHRSPAQLNWDERLRDECNSSNTIRFGSQKFVKISHCMI